MSSTSTFNILDITQYHCEKYDFQAGKIELGKATEFGREYLEAILKAEIYVNPIGAGGHNVPHFFQKTISP